MTMYGELNHIGCATLLKQQIGLEATRSIKRTSILVCVYGLIVTYASCQIFVSARVHSKITVASQYQWRVLQTLEEYCKENVVFDYR
jgi:hypothetical protein